MANERTYPCPSLRRRRRSRSRSTSRSASRTYRQVRPNPYAVVAREDLAHPSLRHRRVRSSRLVRHRDRGRAGPGRPLSRLCGGLAQGSRQAPGRRDPPHHPPAQEVRHRARLQRRRPGRELAADLEAWRDARRTDSAEKANGLAQIFYVATRLGDRARRRGARPQDARERPGPVRRQRPTRATLRGRTSIERNWPFEPMTPRWLDRRWQRRRRWS